MIPLILFKSQGKKLSIDDRKILSLNPILYAPLRNNFKDLVGGLIASTQGNTYTNGSEAVFDGDNDSLNLYSWGLASIWNGDEFTVDIKIKVSSVGVWTDGVARNMLKVVTDTSDALTMRRGTTNNQVQLFRTGGGVVEQSNPTGQSSLDFIRYTITASVSGDALRTFVNGIQFGTTQTGLLAWTGAMVAATTVIGAQDNTATPAGEWSGWITRVSIWNRALTPAEVLALPT